MQQQCPSPAGKAVFELYHKAFGLYCKCVEKMPLHSHGLTPMFYKMMFTANKAARLEAQHVSFISSEAACSPAATEVATTANTFSLVFHSHCSCQSNCKTVKIERKKYTACPFNTFLIFRSRFKKILFTRNHAHFFFFFFF